MEALANVKWERFAQEVVKGAPASTAYRQAGYMANTHSAEAAASRLMRNDKVKARIDELAAKAAEERALVAKKALDQLEVSTERVVRELALLGFSNMQDYIRAGTDFSQLTRDQTAAVIEVQVTVAGDGVHVSKFKLADKRGALIGLLKHCKEAEEAKVAATPDPIPPPQRVTSVDEWRAKYVTRE